MPVGVVPYPVSTLAPMSPMERIMSGMAADRKGSAAVRHQARKITTVVTAGTQSRYRRVRARATRVTTSMPGVSWWETTMAVTSTLSSTVHTACPCRPCGPPERP